MDIRFLDERSFIALKEVKAIGLQKKTEM